MEERRSSSPPPLRKATTAEWLLAFPEKLPRGFTRPRGRAERAFNVLSIAVLILFAIGWSWSIAGDLYLAIIFVVSASYLAAGTYNPFIYFRF